MKRSLIFLLAAGPLFVFGQRVDRSPTFKSFQFPAPGPGPGPGRSGDTAFFQRWLTGPGMPVRLLSGLPVIEPSSPAGFAVRAPFARGFTVREIPPDRMPCLVPLWTAEQMPMSKRGNADPLPNAVPRH